MRRVSAGDVVLKAWACCPWRPPCAFVKHSGLLPSIPCATAERRQWADHVRKCLESYKRKEPFRDDFCAERRWLSCVRDEGQP